MMEIMDNERTPDIRRILIFLMNWLVSLMYWSIGRKKRGQA